MSIRVLPLPKVTGIWQHDCSKYPDVIRVPMSDGTVVRYTIDIPQPAPVLRKSLDSFSEICVGYEKPADAGTSDRPAKKGLRGKYTTERKIEQ